MTAVTIRPTFSKDTRPSNGLEAIDGKPTISRADGDEPETRLGPDGPHAVPPPSVEEELAEREEAKAAGVPAVGFSGDAE